MQRISLMPLTKAISRHCSRRLIRICGFDSAGFFGYGASFSCTLLFHHRADALDATRRIGTDILKLVSASADHEMAARLPVRHRPIDGAGAICIHSIGAGDVLIELGIDYDPTAEVQDEGCGEAACPIERPQGYCVVCRISAYRWKHLVRV